MYEVAHGLGADPAFKGERAMHQRDEAQSRGLVLGLFGQGSEGQAIGQDENIVYSRSARTRLASSE